MALRLALYGLVLFGLWGSARLAWQQWSFGGACPCIGSVPACYVALAGYAAMTGGLVLVGRSVWARRSFFAGLALAGGLAMIGSILELLEGQVCPRVGTVPMCYVSLGLAALIGFLFWREYVRGPSHGGTRGGGSVTRALLIALGLALLLAGSVVPGGSVLMAAGLTMLICASPWFRRCLRFLRVRWGWFDRGMDALERVAGRRMGAILERTRPNRDADTP